MFFTALRRYFQPYSSHFKIQQFQSQTYLQLINYTSSNWWYQCVLVWTSSNWWYQFVLVWTSSNWWYQCVLVWTPFAQILWKQSVCNDFLFLFLFLLFIIYILLCVLCLLHTEYGLNFVISVGCVLFVIYQFIFKEKNRLFLCPRIVLNVLYSLCGSDLMSCCQEKGWLEGCLCMCCCPVLVIASAFGKLE